MKLARHWPRLAPGTLPVLETVQAARRTDVQWGAPVFRAPDLPTQGEILREPAFTGNLGRTWEKRATKIS